MKNNNNKNKSYKPNYKSKVKLRKSMGSGNFSDVARKRRMNTYIRAGGVLFAFMFLAAGFILLGIFLKNLANDETDGLDINGEGINSRALIEQTSATNLNNNLENQEDLTVKEQESLKAEISDSYFNYHGAFLDITKITNLEELAVFIERIKARDINAVLLEIKQGDGNITFHVNGTFDAVVGGDYSQLPRIQDIINALHASGIYISGKIICFKDDLAATNYPAWSLSEKSTSMRFTDGNGGAWLNIYSEDSRNYIRDLVKECVNLGFDEIVLDYFYLPYVSDTSKIDYQDNDLAKNDIVREFVTDVASDISDINPKVKFGLNIPIRYFLNMPNIAMGLDPEELIGKCNFFATSFAPSDLPSGALGITNAENSPYETVRALCAKFKSITEKSALRPYIQAFETSGGVFYGEDKIANQRTALNEYGINTWTLINYDNEY